MRVPFSEAELAVVDAELLVILRAEARLTEADSQRIIARLPELTRFKRTPEQVL